MCSDTAGLVYVEDVGNVGPCLYLWEESTNNPNALRAECDLGVSSLSLSLSLRCYVVDMLAERREPVG